MSYREKFKEEAVLDSSVSNSLLKNYWSHLLQRNKGILGRRFLGFPSSMKSPNDDEYPKWGWDCLPWLGWILSLSIPDNVSARPGLFLFTRNSERATPTPPERASELPPSGRFHPPGVKTNPGLGNCAMGQVKGVAKFGLSSIVRTPTCLQGGYRNAKKLLLLLTPHEAASHGISAIRVP